jgi:hypothetical protein
MVKWCFVQGEVCVCDLRSVCVKVVGVVVVLSRVLI